MASPGLIATVAVTLLSGAFQAPLDDRLYGRVTTADGESLEGYLRWDRNESAWTDVLDGLKELPQENLREAERLDPVYAAAQRRERSIVAFGMRISWDEDDEMGAPLEVSGIRFGHIRRLEPVDRSSVRLTLTSGEEVTLRSSSTDIGRGMRGLIVEVPGEEPETVRWSELDRVDFLSPPPGIARPVSRRLFGTVETWSGMRFTGYVAWDRDEALDSDILDGRSDGSDHEIPFGLIRRIEWVSDRSARVFLTDGEEMELRGTNDVDRDNRGIEVADAAFGRVLVQWEEFRSVVFDDPPAGMPRPDSAPGAPLLGTVHARDGRTIEGAIRWDNDEAQAWEWLDGWAGDVRMDIEFGAIASVARLGGDGVLVTLHDGRTFEVADSEDVDGRNRGIFVTPDGRATRLVRWVDLDRVEFQR